LKHCIKVVWCIASAVNIDTCWLAFACWLIASNCCKDCENK
jgi:hypothetical protein